MKSPNHYCPICNSDEFDLLDMIDCGNFDGSRLYRVADIRKCLCCGHVYNYLNPGEMGNVDHYYDQEYAKINKASTENYGDLPGSSNPLTMKRYEHLFNVLLPHLEFNKSIVDIGCAAGGFLNYLKVKSYRNTYGVEPSESYRKIAIQHGLSVFNGSAESTSFKDDSKAVIVMDQVMEHVYDPNKVFAELARIIMPGGHACISVPDAEEYESTDIFPYYWFIMREHLHHFSPGCLVRIAERYGFREVSRTQFRNGMMSDTMVLPSLTMVFEYTGETLTIDPVDHSNANKVHWSDSYHTSNSERMSNIDNRIDAASNLAGEKMICWGIGREFHFLNANLSFWNKDLVLVDGNKFKQENLTVAGMPIFDPSVIREVPPNIPIIVTATAHGPQIKECVARMGCNNPVIELL